MTDSKNKRTFALHPELASAAGKKSQAKYTAEERSKRAKRAAQIRWKNRPIDGMKYEENIK